MENIDNLIEIKRGLREICAESLMEIIAGLDGCEKFYRDIFTLYGIEYSTEMLEQKGHFIAYATKYFIILRLPENKIFHEKEGYNSKYSDIKNDIIAVIDKFYEVYNSCTPENFIEKYVEYFGILDRNLEVMLKSTSKVNLDDSLSSFAKAVKKVHKFKDKNK